MSEEWMGARGMAVEDLSGKEFGLRALLILEPLEKKETGHVIHWALFICHTPAPML